MDENNVFKSRFRFTDEDDVHLLREVLGQNPYEDHNRWNVIQVNMIQIIGKALSVRTLRERVQNLIKKFLAKKKAEEGRSGIEVEITEIDDLLQQIYELRKEFQNKKGKNIVKSRNLKENLSIPLKSKFKTSYQKGYEMREEAALSLGESFIEVPEEVPEVEIIATKHDEAVLEEITENADILMPIVENSTTNRTKTTPAKRSLAQLNIASPSLKRPRTGNLKQNTVQYLSKKNDMQYEVRCGELSLKERKLELDEYERKKRMELEARKIILEEKRVKCLTETISYQQNLIKELITKINS